ncbi:porin [Microbulbifer thermotolerans]|uniref:porin n=1 Tax=Microbulbifer thermotolerans TaxID=252514 RepID=UPI0008E1B135|nr:porin [Microbulbifer thermotolerans]MCX2782305.1 porin [Microbulbifer thermotolerans]MCX2794894.1 porin [Microbulbifer thermotolerans]MCX2831082.1 porin [Microbulbifer thermotolerans]SFB87697.1 Outer membrane protein (porin) [Microbulbifer thermotolerans]
MKKTVIYLAVAMVPALAAAQDDTITFYGKANVAFQSADEGDSSVTDVKSNASRLGIKGALPLDNGVKAIYKMEYQVDIDGDAEETFEQRNIYAGLEGGFGQVIAGKFDTPLKVAQNKVDQFNDLEGDIKSVITRSDNRESNNLQYTTPSFGGFRLSAAYISNREEVIGTDDSGSDITRDDGTSVSVAYDNNGVYLAYAYDMSVEANDWDVQRFVAQYGIGPVQVGALFEEQQKADGSTQDGWLASAAYKINQWTVKAQYGQSDIVVTDAETFSLGLDFHFSRAVKVFGFYTDETAADDYDRSYFGIGTELKF